jgi:hypothetical protein
VYSSPARMRAEREVARRSNAPVVITTLLSLLVVGAAVAAVAYLVLRSPSSAVDSAERLEPVGTALPAPSEPPTLPTSIPTSEPDSDAQPEPTALGFTGDAPAVAGLPTVAAPQEAGPTPTPRVIALATAVPATTVPATVPPQPTLPPAVPVENVPVVALAPVEMAPPPAPTAAVSQSQAVTQPTPVPVEVDDDPFNIFGNGDGAGIAPAQNDALERARALQGGADPSGNADRDRDNAVNVPASIIVDDPNRRGSVEVVMPDVDAMIDEITARATDPNRNPNVGNAGRNNSGRVQEDDNPVVVEPRQNKRKGARERNRNRAATSNSRSVPEPVIPSVPEPVIPNVPVIVPRGSGNDDQACEDPFASLPEDMRPENFPFNNC